MQYIYLKQHQSSRRNDDGAAAVSGNNDFDVFEVSVVIVETSFARAQQATAELPLLRAVLHTQYFAF
jgi:hypothetical protein